MTLIKEIFSYNCAKVPNAISYLSRLPERVEGELTQSIYFDESFYRGAYKIPDTQDALAHFLELGDAEHYRPSLRFDPDYYFSRYPDLHDSGFNPFRHYIEFGSKEGRFPNRFRELLSSGMIDVLVEKRIFAEKSKLDLADDLRLEASFERYLISSDGGSRRCSPSRRFDVEYYLDLYPDVASSGLDPLIHYMTSGRSEGRLISGDLLDGIVHGERALDQSKPTILVVLHELSLTGAPIVGLDVIKAYSPDHNILCISFGGGKLEPQIANECAFYTVRARGYRDCHIIMDELLARCSIDYAVVNSVEATAALPALHARLIPVVTLIHEYEQYTFPKEKVDRTVFYSSHIVFSSDHVRSSWQRSVLERYGFEFQHSSVQHQSLPANTVQAMAALGSDLVVSETRKRLADKYKVRLEDKLIVMGGGWISARKGVDLFISVAGAVRALLRANALDEDQVLFLWIGDGLIEDDLHYGLWLHEQAKSEPTFKNLPANADFHDFMASSDIFFCSSRLDPFPNVVIDAVTMGRPVALFEGATGCPEVLGRIEVPYISVPAFDIAAAAESLYNELATSQLASAITSDVARRVLKEFGSGKLESHIRGVFDTLRLGRASRNQNPLRSTLDPNFVQLPMAYAFGDARDAQESVISFWDKCVASGNLYFNPAPGFNIRQLMLSDGPLGPTHASTDLSAAAIPESCPAIYLHFHAFYTEGLEDIVLSYGRSLRAATKIIVTTDSDEKADRIAEVASFTGLNLTTVIQPNRGRDYGPFFALLEEGYFEGADYVAHLHAKGTPSIGAHALTSWQAYLYDVMLMDGNLQKIVALMQGSPDVVLAFPEDRHCLGWGKNESLAQALLPSVPSQPLQFPIGSMFVIQFDVLEQVWRSSGIKSADLPGEPIPYDGTVLHAIERLWPIWVRGLGREFTTVFEQGITRR